MIQQKKNIHAKPQNFTAVKKKKNEKKERKKERKKTRPKQP
jgi:hypothetical protein